jgi:hypothetical protein
MRMGEYLKHAPAEVVDESERAYFRAHLARATEDFAQSSPLDERVSKVLKDAVQLKRRPLISLAILGKGQDLGWDTLLGISAADLRAAKKVRQRLCAGFFSTLDTAANPAKHRNEYKVSATLYRSSRNSVASSIMAIT